MAVHTNTFYPDTFASFTATVATVSGTAWTFPFINGPAVHGNVGVQGVYIRQGAQIYRWLKDKPIEVGGTVLTAYSYQPYADDPIYTV